MTSDTDAVATRRLGAVALIGVAVCATACSAVQCPRSDYDWQRVPLSFYVLGRYGRVAEASYFVLACGLVALGIGWYRALCCGAHCTCSPIRHRMCSRTPSACGSPHPTKAGASART